MNSSPNSPKPSSSRQIGGSHGLFRSIRWRLQLWHGLILVAVVTGMGWWVYRQASQAWFQEIDARLEASARYLEVTLRQFPPFELEPGGQRPPPGPPGGGPPDDFAPPGPFRPGGPPGAGPNGPGGAAPDQLGPPDGPPGLGPPSRERLYRMLALPSGADTHAASDAAAVYFAVWRGNGEVVKASANAPAAAPDDAEFGADIADQAMASRFRQRGEFREVLLRGPHVTRVLVGQSDNEVLARLGWLRWQLVLAGGAVVLLGLVGGWLLAGRVIRPIAAMSATAAAISASNLSQRINVAGVESELGQLAEVLNAMFDRLQDAFQRQAAFVADASHELRTPIAILLSHTELALSKPRSTDEYRQTLETCLRAVRRMKSLAEGLLTLARADAGKLDLQHDSIALDRLVEEGVASMQPLAHEKSVSLFAQVEPVAVVGDAGRLTQVLTNLLANAIAYNVPQGRVTVRLGCDNGEAVLAVADTGCGIPEADRQHIFERFFRVDKARSRETGGYGLGLAICRSIVESHGGTIGFDSQVHQGTTFTVRLPRTT